MKFKVYGKNQCSYCFKAVQLLDRKGYGEDYVYINIENDAAGRDFIVNQEGHKSVPQVYMDLGNDEMLIGGYEDLVEYLKEEHIGE